MTRYVIQFRVGRQWTSYTTMNDLDAAIEAVKATGKRCRIVEVRRRVILISEGE